MRCALILLTAGRPGIAWAGGPGAAGATFLRFPVGPRAVGMGEAQAAAAEGAYAAYWNPAALALSEFPEFAATHNRSFSGVSHQYLSVAWPLRYGSTLNMNLTRLGMSSFDSFDAVGARTGETDYASLSAGLAYGRALTVDEAERPALSAGMGLKRISERLGSAGASGFALDAGLLWVRRFAAAQEARLGLAATNLGPGLKFDAETTPLPTLYRAGVAWRRHTRDDALTVSLDRAMGTDEPGFAALGVEYEVWRMLALRLGWKLGQDVGSGFRGGVGFRLKRFSFEYSFASFGELGAMQRAGLTVRLGGPVRWSSPEASARLRQEERENRRYVEEAQKLWEGALGADGLGAKTMEDRRRLARLANLAKTLDLGARPDRVSALGAKTPQAALGYQAASAYLDGAARKALLFAQSAHGTDRDREAFAALLNAIASLTYQKPEADELLPLEGIVAKKLGKALAAFKAGRYHEAEEFCREALLLKPDSAAVYERLGSVYFAMDLREKALSEWRESLRLDPANAALRDFLRRLGDAP